MAFNLGVFGTHKNQKTSNDNNTKTKPEGIPAYKAKEALAQIEDSRVTEGDKMKERQLRELIDTLKNRLNQATKIMGDQLNQSKEQQENITKLKAEIADVQAQLKKAQADLKDKLAQQEQIAVGAAMMKANDYADSIKEEAEKYANSLKNDADNYAKSVRDKAENDRQNIINNAAQEANKIASKIVDEAKNQADVYHEQAQVSRQLIRDSKADVIAMRNKLDSFLSDKSIDKIEETTEKTTVETTSDGKKVEETTFKQTDENETTPSHSFTLPAKPVAPKNETAAIHQPRQVSNSTPTFAKDEKPADDNVSTTFNVYDEGVGAVSGFDKLVGMMKK